MTLASQSRYFIRKATPNGCLVSDLVDFQIGMHGPIKTLLQEKVLFLAFLQNNARSCGILWDFAGILLQDSCKIQAKSHKILQECKKKDLFLQDLAIVGSIIAIMSCCSEKIGPPPKSVRWDKLW